MFEAHRPAGIILFARNIVEPLQLAVLMAGLRAVLPQSAVLMVDQEGGRVARLKPPHWRAHPSAGQIGAVHARDAEAGLRAAWLTGALIGLDCAEAGFDVVCAPVLDLRVAGAHEGVVGDRAFGADPQAVAALGRAMAEGLLASGIQPVGKHAPGHGRARIDSHVGLPVVEATEDELAADLMPFRANADLPWMIPAHIVYPAYDPSGPATMSRIVLDEIVRGRTGFAGVLCSDDLAMAALSGTPAERAMAAVAAGCDLALYCPGDAEGTCAVLASVPELTDAATARLARAAALAPERRLALDPAALLSEREAILP